MWKTAAAKAARWAAAAAFPMGRGGLGIGTVIVLGLVGWALGIDPALLIGGAEMMTREQPRVEAPRDSAPRRTGAPQDPTGRFVSNVLGSTEVTWKTIFAKDGKNYRAAGAGDLWRSDRCQLRWRGAERHGSVLLPAPT